MRVRLHIDRLVLEGISANAHERAAIGASVEAELGRLIGEGGIDGSLQTGGSVPRLHAPRMEHRGDPARVTGQKIARSVYGSLASGK